MCVSLSITATSCFGSPHFSRDSTSYRPNPLCYYKHSDLNSWQLAPSSLDRTLALRPPNYYPVLPPRLPALKLAEPWTLDVLLYPQLFFQLSNLSFPLQLGVGVQPVCPQLEACPLGQPFISLLCGGSPCAVPQTHYSSQRFGVSPLTHSMAHKHLTCGPPFPT